MKYRNIDYDSGATYKVISICFNYKPFILIKELEVYKRHCFFRILNDELTIFIFE